MSYRSQTISAVILTQNHAPVLERCLESVKWIDEIIILDAGSTDNTLEIARRYTQTIYFCPARDISARRNFAYSMVKTDWVLSIDPNEWVEEMLRHEIDGMLLNVQPDLVAYSISKRMLFQGQELISDSSARSIRLFKKGAGRADSGPYPHRIHVEGDVGKLDRVIGFEPFTNLEQWFDTVNDNSTLAAYQSLESGRAAASSSVWDLLLQTNWTFLSAFLKHSRFGMNGLTMALAKTVEQYLTLNKIRALCKSKG